jgi:glycosyltransferase involved in cell wall biosynthesis
MQSNYKSCIVLGANARSLGNFRGDLVKSLSNRKLHVILASSKPDSGDLDFINNFDNINYRIIHLKRNGLNFYNDIKTLFNIFSLTKKTRPGFILAYGIKLVIWGGLSARISRTPFFALITGLGFAFQGESFKRKMLEKLVTILYRAALKNSKAVIFQNADNRDVFVKKGIVELSKTHIVNGSGVDLKKYDIEEIPDTNIKFLCLSRLLGEKGLREYAEAAKIVKDKFPDVEFVLVGPEDSSPDAIPLNEVDSWSDYINYKGPTDDVRPYIKDSHVYVLPSYHEGLPRSTLEAMSMGRPVLTTNAVGCKETVEEGINGFKVPVKSSGALAKKMIWFIENSGQIGKMGIESRKMVEDKFDVHKVNKEMLKIMEIE